MIIVNIQKNKECSKAPTSCNSRYVYTGYLDRRNHNYKPIYPLQLWPEIPVVRTFDPIYRLYPGEMTTYNLQLIHGRNYSVINRGLPENGPAKVRRSLRPPLMTSAGTP